MSVNIYSDQSRNVNWTVREKTDATLTVNVTLSDVAYNISSYTFIAEFFKIGTTSPFLTLTTGSGITNGGATGILTIALTDTQLTITPDQYFWKLRTTAPTDNLWFNGEFYVNGYVWDGGSDSTVTVALTIGNTTISLELIISGSTNDSYVASNVPVLTDISRKYGYDGTAITGNFTASVTAAQEGIISKILHNGGTEPTITSTVTVYNLSIGAYVINQNNEIYIWCHKNTAGTVTAFSYTVLSRV